VAITINNNSGEQAMLFKESIITSFGSILGASDVSVTVQGGDRNLHRVTVDFAGLPNSSDFTVHTIVTCADDLSSAVDLVEGFVHGYSIDNPADGLELDIEIHGDNVRGSDSE